MKRLHWFIVALVVFAIVALPPWFSVRGAGSVPLLFAPGARAPSAGAPNRREAGGDLRSSGARVFVGGGSRAGK